MKSKNYLCLIVWFSIGILMPLQIMAAGETEYYGGEITLTLQTSKTIELGEIGYDLIYQYGIKNGHSWYSDNRNIMTVPTEGRFSCTIYGSRIGETKLHYSCVYVRDNMYYDYKCYWDVKVVPSGSENDDYPETWTSEGNYSTSWYNGNQSEYELSSSEDFAGLAYLVNNKGYTFKGKTVKLTKDISLEGKDWSTIGIEDSKPFKGTFDGQGHVITDVYVSDQKDDQINYGVWGCIDGATIKNLTVKGNVVVIPYLTTYFPQQRIGGLVGYAKETCNIEKCRSDVKITYSRNIQREGSVGWIYMGGLVGNAPQSKISYCAHSGDLWCFQSPEEAYYHEAASNYIGGIVGNAGSDTNIEFCENSSSNIYSRMPYSTYSTATVYLGGIAGYGGDSFSYCRSVYTAFSVVAEHERFKLADKLQIGGIQGAKPNYGGSYRNCYSSINMVWVSSVSGRYNPAAFYGLGPGSCYNGYSNSDIIFETNISLSKKNEGNYSSSGMKGNAFLEELNQYAIEKLGHAVWTPDEDNYPCIEETHNLGKNTSVSICNITLSKYSLSLETGQEETLTATVEPDNATDKSVTWTSSSTSVATVDSNGKVTAKAKGSATITCTANDGSGKQATCTVTVTDPIIKVTSITLNKTSLSLQTGQNETLMVTVKPDNATDKTVTWSSDKESVATVDRNGKVTAKAKGTSKITCTANDGSGKYATCSVTVTDPQPDPKIVLSASHNSGEVEKGTVVTISANVEGATIYYWINDDPTASASSPLKITINENTEISAIAKKNGYTDSDELRLKYTIKQGSVPISISLPTTEKVDVGSTVKLTPTIVPANAITTLTWDTDDKNIAKVSQQGVVMGIKEGTAIISVTTDNGLTADCFVLVNKPSGINDVQGGNSTNVPVFSLSGQRLAAPRKGINIVGGKKVIVK